MLIAHFRQLPTIFVAVLLGGIFLPVPHDAVLISAGYFASASSASLVGTIIVSIVALLIIDAAIFALGAVGGPLFRWLMDMISPKARQWAADHFLRRAAPTIFVGRLIAGLRLAVPLVAGSTKYPFWKYLLYDTIALTAYSTLFVLLGFVFHGNVSRLMTRLGLLEHTVILVTATAAVTALVVYLSRRYLTRKKGR